MLYKKVTGMILVVMLLMLVMSGVVGASPSSPSYGSYYDGDGYIQPVPAPAPIVKEPNVDPSWIRFRGMDRYFVSLTVGSSQVVNIDVPGGLAPYQLSWMSLDTSVATVVANSPARITGTGVGETWVLAVVQTDTHTYYDAVLVEVLGPTAVAGDDVEATPTPPTYGGFGYFYSVIYALLVSIVGIVVLRRSIFES